MANKKSGKKQKKVAKTSSKKTIQAKRPVSRKAKKPAKNKKKIAAKKAAPKKKSPPRKTAAKANTAAATKKTAAAKAANARTKVSTKVPKKWAPARMRRFDEDPYETQGLISGSTTESGDTQGLSNVESADSESVDELVEEGNAFEADVVAGVERAGDRPGKEVRTREVPEDDVPEEYLDQD
jgi:hypothetical protein